jgi:GntR family transcriptional regulator
MSQELHERLGYLINQTEPGGRLPSEPKLAEILGVSRATLREAMRTFETQGRLRRLQGVGTFVTHPRNLIESGLEVLESIETQAERINLPVTYGELSIETQIAGENIGGILEVEPDTQLIRVSRVIFAEDRPIAYLVDILPEDVLSDEEINNGFNGSVLDLLLQKGELPLDSSRCEISAVSVPLGVARALNIQKGVSLLCFTAVLFSENGIPLDYSLSYFLPGYFRFHVVRKVGKLPFLKH